MKRFFAPALAAILLVAVGCSTAAPTVAPQVAGNFTAERKLPYALGLSPVDGADSIERLGDHSGSPCFAHPDIYNRRSSETLAILPQCKTTQQMFLHRRSNDSAFWTTM